VAEVSRALRIVWKASKKLLSDQRTLKLFLNLKPAFCREC
jgi:hypothetical protein